MMGGGTARASVCSCVSAYDSRDATDAEEDRVLEGIVKFVLECHPPPSNATAGSVCSSAGSSNLLLKICRSSDSAGAGHNSH